MQLTSGDIFLVFFWVMWTYLLWVPPVWLLMRFLAPKSLVDNYFKKPHFTSAELVLFAHFPGSLIRTGIFMTLCLQPQRGRKRQITDIKEHCPHWFVVASKCFLIANLSQALLFILLLIGLSIYTFF